MIKFKEFLRKKAKVLRVLTILEIIFITLMFVSFIGTFEYTFDLAFNDITQPWLGDNTTDLSTKYNIALMDFLGYLGTIAFIMFLAVNIVRFILISKKYKLYFVVGILSLIASFIGCGINAQMNSGILSVCIGVWFILGVYGIVYSHKTEKVEQVEKEDCEEVKI